MAAASSSSSSSSSSPLFEIWKNVGKLVGDGLTNVKAIAGVWSSSSQETIARTQPLLACLSSRFSRPGIGRGRGWLGQEVFQLALSPDHVAQRLDGIPVYTVCNSSDEFILVSDTCNVRSLGVFCFRRDDANALLEQVRDREPGLGRGAKVVAVSLSKVYKMNSDGIAFRFLPDPLQVKNAIEARAKAGDPGMSFDGVPIFQSDNLILRSNNQRYCPIFFRKEDLETALRRAFNQQQKVNPLLRVKTDIQVGSFEDVLKRMETNDEDSGWEDVVFIPPGVEAILQIGRHVIEYPKGTTVVG